MPAHHPNTTFDPDVIWAWLVVAAAFLNNALTSGLFLSLSGLYASWLEEFGYGQAVTSWTVNIAFFVKCSAAPIAASLTTRFGHRTVAMAGGVITCCSLCLSSLVGSVEMLIVAVGLGPGIGASLVFIATMTFLPAIFHRHLSLAVGVATSGTGFGTFALSPLLNVLEESYGWRGTLLVLGAVTLHQTLAGMLLRSSTTGSGGQGSVSADARRGGGDADVGSCVAGDVGGEGLVSTDALRGNDGHEMNACYCFTNALGKTWSRSPLPRDIAGCEVTDVGTHPATTPIPPATPYTRRSPLEGRGCGRILVANATLLSDTAFVLFGLSNVLRNISTVGPLLYMVDRAMGAGIDKAVAVVCVSVYGVANTAGRLAFGLVVNQWTCRPLSRPELLLYVMCLTVSGGATVLIPLCGSSVVLHGTNAAVLGILQGGSVSLLMPVLVDLVGRDTVTLAYGLLMGIMSLGFLMGPLTGGVVYDWSQSYDQTYVVHGLFIVAGGLVLLPLAWRRPWNCFHGDAD